MMTRVLASPVLTATCAGLCEKLVGEGYYENILLFCIPILKYNFHNIHDALSEERSLQNTTVRVGRSWWSSGEDCTPLRTWSQPLVRELNPSRTAWLKKQNVEENSVCSKDPVL